MRKDKNSIGVKTEADRFLGFALTKDSFCMKGMWWADCIIPYGNIKEVKDSFNDRDKEIIFFINKNEVGYITLSRSDWSFDRATLKQIKKYLNIVKDKYSPEYDKIFLKSTISTGLFFKNETPWLPGTGQSLF